MGFVDDQSGAVFKQLDYDVVLEEPVLVKPSTEAACLNTSPLFLSNFEQGLAFTVETVYIYGAVADKGNEKVADVMKAALVKALDHYDILGGRMKLNDVENRIEINRNYKGAQFATASCNATVAELGDLNIPHPFFRKFVPQAHNVSTVEDVPLMMIQVTTFQCGGFAIGFGMSHLLWDGIGCFEFFMNLVSFARGGEAVYTPKFDRTMLKARNPPTPKYDHPEYISLDKLSPGFKAGTFTKPETAKAEFEAIAASQNCITKTIPFTLQELTALKKQAMEDGVLSKTSTFEVVSGHVWQARTKALELEPTHVATLMYAVDIRKRLQPNLPAEFCGNGVYSACARATCLELQTSSPSFPVKKIQEANDIVTEDYIRSALDWWEVYRGVPPIIGDTFYMTSWLKMPFYSIDFGWGTPLYSGPVASQMVEFIVLFPNGKNDGGINLILSLPPPVMAKFEQYVKVRL
ncbi:unnamed protein product [Sphagnum jensenii]|uniref:Uncharacterized protein n=2 Tax=Sphagnum jensenii TaxID=128206 RepID=A0ABP0XM46_9BRYO